jgi:hypothetical protein
VHKSPLVVVQLEEDVVAPGTLGRRSELTVCEHMIPATLLPKLLRVEHADPRLRRLIDGQIPP